MMKQLTLDIFILFRRVSAHKSCRLLGWNIIEMSHNLRKY